LIRYGMTCIASTSSTALTVALTASSHPVADIVTSN
jgi:hypothetical protein